MRFLKLAHGGVCGPEPLPVLSQLIDGEVISPGPGCDVLHHPAHLVTQAEQSLGLPTGSLEVEGEFHEQVDVDGGPLDIYLARFTAIDPPLELTRRHDGEFIDLTQARGLPVTELELLRKVYEFALGG
jgi:hypothetical protein